MLYSIKIIQIPMAQAQTFAQVFQNKGCMRKKQEASKCFDLLLPLVNAVPPHIFTRAEFDTFIDRITYGKTQSSFLSHCDYVYYNQEKDKYSKILETLFKQHSPTQKQLDSMIACNGPSNYGPPNWTRLFVANCDISQLNIDKLEFIGFPKNEIINLKHLNAITTDTIESMIISYYNHPDAEKGILNILAANGKILTTDLLNRSLSDLYAKCSNSNIINKKACMTQIVNIFINHVVPNDQTTLLIDVNGIYDIHLIRRIIKEHQLTNKYIINTLCRNQNTTILLDPQYNIPFDIQTVNCWMKYKHVYNIDHDLKRVLQLACKDNHYLVQFPNNSVKEFSVLDYAMYLNIVPNARTFKISCKYMNTDLFDACTMKYQMVPTNVHLDYVLTKPRENAYGYQEMKAGTYEKLREMIIKILSYKMVPTRDNFRSLVDWNISTKHTFFNELFDLFVKFGMVIDHDDIVYALKHKILIHSIESFNIQYDERIYYYCMIYNYRLSDEELAKFNIDIQVLKMRAMCRDVKPAEFRQFIIKNKLHIDRFCIEIAAKEKNKQLFDYLLTFGLSPSPTSFVLISDNFGAKYYSIYLDTLGKFKIDWVYMAEQSNDGMIGILDGMDHVHNQTALNTDWSNKIYDKIQRMNKQS